MWDGEQFRWDILTLGAAALLGGLMGVEREAHGRWAGLRTHMLVAVGTCLFVLVGMAAGGDHATVVSRVLQGIAAGIGFIGAGTILKLTDKLEVRGLTTASSIWTAAAMGAACGLGRFDLAVAGTLLALAILLGLREVELRLSPNPPSPPGGEGSTRREPDSDQEGLSKKARGQ